MSVCVYMDALDPVCVCCECDGVMESCSFTPLGAVDTTVCSCVALKYILKIRFASVGCCSHLLERVIYSIFSSCLMVVFPNFPAVI